MGRLPDLFSNLTSAGQFAGMNLIFAGSGYFEVALTTFVINLRYMLMSLSLTQRIERSMGTIKRMLAGFAVTDEIFVVASLNPGTLKAPYWFGLIALPIAGWNLEPLWERRYRIFCRWRFKTPWASPCTACLSR